MNAAHNEEDIRLVEMGPVFSESGYSDYSQSPKVEEWRLAVLWMPRSIDTKRPWAGKEDVFFSFKGMCESALGSFAGRPQKFLEKCFHPKRMWKSSGGIAGELHPSILKKLDISGRVFAGEWSLKIHERAWKFQAPAVLPTVDLDVCFEVQQSVALAEIEALIEKKKNSWLESFRAYDVFEDEKILGAGKRAITFALRYRDAQRTLSLEEVKQEHEKLVKVVIEGLGSHRASLR
jgi:phenylalanyl-tRNA synthetase beta chain